MFWWIMYHYFAPDYQSFYQSFISKNLRMIKKQRLERRLCVLCYFSEILRPDLLPNGRRRGRRLIISFQDYSPNSVGKSASQCVFFPLQTSVTEFFLLPYSSLIFLLSLNLQLTFQFLTIQIEINYN